jgi:hypothetical protein
MTHSTRLCSVLLIAALATPAAAQSRPGTTEREYEENGVRYRETVHTSSYPTWETRYEERPVMREQVTFDRQKSQRVVYRPVVEYRWQSVLRNRFNLFAEPYWAYELVPVTRWEAYTETYELPIPRREWVADKSQTVRVPVMAQRMVEEKIVRRVAISDAKGSPEATVARRESTSGKRLDGDPPRKLSRSTSGGSSGEDE